MTIPNFRRQIRRIWLISIPVWFILYALIQHRGYEITTLKKELATEVSLREKIENGLKLYAKKDDLSEYTKRVELAEYAKKDDLMKSVWKGR